MTTSRRSRHTRTRTRYSYVVDIQLTRRAGQNAIIGLPFPDYGVIIREARDYKRRRGFFFFLTVKNTVVKSNSSVNISLFLSLSAIAQNEFPINPSAVEYCIEIAVSP